MKVGTKSILFGAHCCILHPWFVFAAWCKLYGFPWDPRLWFAFVLHDLGYWGKPNMDGPEGEIHVEWAAAVMTRVFGVEWGDFCRYHSRFYSKRDGKPYSRLCVADKLAISLTPGWLYLPMVKLSGELAEYMELARTRGAALDQKYASMNCADDDPVKWYANVQEYLRKWVAEHRDGREDKWTPNSAIYTAGPGSPKVECSSAVLTIIDEIEQGGERFENRTA